MPKFRKFMISKDEDHLLKLEYFSPSTSYSKIRAEVILLKSYGYINSKISKYVKISSATISSWVTRYEKEGLNFILSQSGSFSVNEITTKKIFENEIISKQSKSPFKCTCCGKEYPEHTKKYFMQHIVAGKYLLSSICKECKKNRRYDREYSSDKTKLLCHKCMQYKSISEFHIDSRPKDKLENEGQYRILYRNGRKSFCKDCAKKVERERYIRRDDKNKLYKYLQSKWLGARDRAKRKELEFTITKDDIINKYNEQKGKCALTGIDMTFEMYNNRTHTNISIDRIDSNKGYIIDNIQLVCMAVNQFKNDIPMDEFIFICKRVADKFSNNEYICSK